MRSIEHQEASLYTPKGRRKYLTPEERERFIGVANKCNRVDLGTLALTLAYTGCRITEALSLTRDAINLETGFIAIRTLKRRRVFAVREIPVPPYFLNILELAYGISCGEPEARIWTLSRSQFWRLIKELMREAGVAYGVHATPKGLRHGFGVHAVRSGVPLNLIQRWLGHSSMKTTAIYLQVIGREEREIAARMWASDLRLSGP